MNAKMLLFVTKLAPISPLIRRVPFARGGRKFGTKPFPGSHNEGGRKMTQTITRLYANGADAEAAVKNLKENRFGDKEIFVVGPPTSGKANVDNLAATIAQGAVPKADAAIYAKGVAKGGTLVTVQAPFGSGAKASGLLDSNKPIPSGVTPAVTTGGFSLGDLWKSSARPNGSAVGSLDWNDAAPLSSWFGWPTLLDDATPFSSYWKLNVLKDTNDFVSNKWGWSLLKDSSTPLPDRLLSESPTPLSDKFGWRVLKDDPTPASDKFGWRVLKDDPTPLSNKMNWPVLKDDPTPLSNKLGWKVLS